MKMPGILIVRRNDPVQSHKRMKAIDDENKLIHRMIDESIPVFVSVTFPKFYFMGKDLMQQYTTSD